MESESRLEALVRLLGSRSALERREATRQLAELGPLEAAQLASLLAKLAPLLLHPAQWTARVAAAAALGPVLASLDPADRGSPSSAAFLRNYVPLARLRLQPVLRSKAFLLSRERAEPEGRPELSAKEQRERAEQTLGLHPRVGLDSRAWFSDEDLRCTVKDEPQEEGGAGQSLRPEFVRVELAEVLAAGEGAESTLVDVLRLFAAFLVQRLRDASWEVRHGAATALKAVLGSAASRSLLPTEDLEGATGELLLLVCLDRFNDFSGGLPTAPVREAAAQTLALLHGSSAVLAQAVETGARSLCEEKDGTWEARQSGLLLLKYLLAKEAATEKSSSPILEAFSGSLMEALGDGMVGELVLGSLGPVLRLVLEAWPRAPLREALWSQMERALGREDFAGLSATLDFLARFLEADSAVDLTEEQLLSLLSCLDNPDSAVRTGAYACVRVSFLEGPPAWPDVTLQLVFRALFRRLILEPHAGALRSRVAEDWRSFLSAAGTEASVRVVLPYLGVWLGSLLAGELNPVLESAWLFGLGSGGGVDSAESGPSRLFLGGEETMSLCEADRAAAVLQTKEAICEAVAQSVDLMGSVEGALETGESPAESVRLLLSLHLESPSLYKRWASALVLRTWAWLAHRRSAAKDELLELGQTSLTSPPLYYEETALRMAEATPVALIFVRALVDYNQALPAPHQVGPVIAASGLSVLDYCRKAFEETLGLTHPSRRARVEEIWATTEASLRGLEDGVVVSHGRLSLGLACALVGWGRLGDKLTPVVRPLMEAVKMETAPALVRQASLAIARLLRLCRDRSPSPNHKVLSNLISWLHPDSDEDSRRAVNATAALRVVAEELNGELASEAPRLWQALASFTSPEGFSADKVRSRLLSVQCAWEALGGAEKETLWPQTARNLVQKGLASPEAEVRQLSARVLSRIRRSHKVELMNEVLLEALEAAADLSSTAHRSGVVEWLGLEVAEEGALLGLLSIVAPALLARMSDSEAAVRETAGMAFSRLVGLLPVEAAEEPLQGLSPELVKRRATNLDLLNLLTSPSRLARLELPFQLEGVTLRAYQEEGVAWMWFLRQFSLSGILCDDMGLGKTLQSIAVLAADRLSHSPPSPSLVVCPKTLTGHWREELQRFLRGQVFRVVGRLTELRSPQDLLVTSYDVVRKSPGEFAGRLWHYVVLDEGHVMRNPKTQLFKALTSLRSSHRLILSGTPVQNSVTDLWALFHFLMPGYLGTQQEFNARFTRPILKSKSGALSIDQDAKAEEGKETEVVSESEAALKRLHQTVLPFILRRLKTEVLKELPPKTIQDHYCDMSPLQAKLYEDLERRLEKAEEGSRPSAFQTLAYLRKLCDHPCLVQPAGEQRRALAESGKMLGLAELLAESGIGAGRAEGEALVAPHRALVFCQFKAAVELIEEYLRSGELGGGGVSWLRLDGSVPPAQRQAVANRFNADPSIDLLLLTTQVGGLGLNLTGADVVVFVDHDWNPSRDLQAMDRAHRLGQRRAVHVYRLITRGTLEERVLRLQAWKTATADAVVGADNASLLSMATDSLLSILARPSDQDPSTAPKGASRAKRPKPAAPEEAAAADDGLGDALEGIGELWDQSQYDQAFDIHDFLSHI